MGAASYATSFSFRATTPGGGTSTKRLCHSSYVTGRYKIRHLMPDAKRPVERPCHRGDAGRRAAGDGWHTRCIETGSRRWTVPSAAFVRRVPPVALRAEDGVLTDLLTGRRRRCRRPTFSALTLAGRAPVSP